jgi:hypothetical protein
VRALAANERDLRLDDLFETQHVALDHRDASGAVVPRRGAVLGRLAGISSSVEPATSTFANANSAANIISAGPLRRSPPHARSHS